ncbi:MAG: hypothetical protein WC471_06090 [Candidatus Woesearchaeota archaeon]
MTTETTPFSVTTENTATTAPTITLPQEVADLVGAGKKYATPEDALKSVPHAQNHIKTLTEELQAAKAELEKRKTAEQLLDEIKSGIKTTEQPSTSQITPDTVTQLIEQTINRKTQETVETQNVGKVTNAFSGKFGEKAEEVYKQLAVDSGLTLQQLNLLSKTSPAVVLKLAGFADTKQPNVEKLSSSVNTEGFGSSQNTQGLSARVKQGASTKDLTNAWKIAGQKIGKPS